VPLPASPDSEHDAGTLDRAGYEVVFEEDFTGPALAADRWVAQYLPQWSTPERSAARYDLETGVLTLRIDADQPPWLPDGEQLRVSNIQTGSFSGPAGSDRGTHRHRSGLTVRTAQPTRRLYTPSTGMVAARLRATTDPTCMLAVWLVGFEEAAPEQSGEICIAELYGHAIGPGGSTVRMGIKAHHDPGLREDMADVGLDIDATGWHTYAAAWTTEETRFYVDDRLVRMVSQGLGYPLQLMVDLFEFPAGPVRDPAAYPKTGKVASVRGYRPTGPERLGHFDGRSVDDDQQQR
jgi:hypothetical protein